jgi:hypothetical protein
MKGAILLVLAAVVLALAPAALAGDLKPCACDPNDASMSCMSRSSASGQQFAKPAADAGTVHPDALVATLAPQNKVKVAVDAAKADAKNPDVLRFDFTGAGKFADATSMPMKAVDLGSQPAQGFFMATFGPTTFDVKSGDKVMKVTVVGQYQKYKNGNTDSRMLMVTMAAAAEGVCDFGGKTYKVRLLDGNGNLKLGDASKVENAEYGMISGDVLLVDTGDGTFTKDVKKSFFGQPVLLDGKAYTVTVNDDASKIEAAEAKIELGAVKIEASSWSATFVGKKYHSVVSSGTDKPIFLPADTYTVWNYWGQGEGNSGLAINKMAGMVEVGAGKTAEVKVGAPLTVGLSIQNVEAKGLLAKVFGGGETNLVINLDCQDVSGSPVSRIMNGKGGMAPAPKLTIFDSAGKQVYQATLEYG